MNDCKTKCSRYQRPIGGDFYLQGFMWCTKCERPIPHTERHASKNGTEKIRCNCCNQKCRVSADIKRELKNVYACLITTKQIFVVNQQAPLISLV